MSDTTIASHSVAPIVVLRSLATALRAADLRAAGACFTRHACMVTPDGTAVHGREAITPLLAQLIASATEIEARQSVIHRAGDVAHFRAEWTIHSRRAAGAGHSSRTRPTAVLQRLEGNWRIAFLSPWDSL